MPRVIFHHIDKCAGTSVLKYLQNFFDSEQCLYMEEHSSWMEAGNNKLDPDRLARAHFIHDPYGAWNWKERVSNAATFGFLRDPLDRLISNWWMVQRWTDQEASAFPDGLHIRDLACNQPADFFSSHHPQCRYLNWNRIASHLACAPREYAEAWQKDALDSKEFRTFMMKRAEKTLRSFSFIGFKEDFARSLSALQLWLSLPPEQPQPLNIHASDKQKPKLNEEALTAASQTIDLDQQLVAIARELYEEQMERFQARYGMDLPHAAEKNYNDALVRPAEWTVINMSQPLNGTGWHCRERNGNKYSRWIGPTPIATIDLPFRKEQDLLVRFRVTNILSSPQADNLTLEVDGHAVPLYRWSEDTFIVAFDAVVPLQAQNQSDAILRLKFNCAETILMTDPNDGRRLGLEVCEIEVGPLKAFILQSPGTPDFSDEARGMSTSRNA